MMSVMPFGLISYYRNMGHNWVWARPVGCQQSALHLRWEGLTFFCLPCERNPNLFLLPYLLIWNPGANPNINKVAMGFYDYLKNLSQVRLECCQGKVLRSHSARHTLATFFLPVSCIMNAASAAQSLLSHRSHDLPCNPGPKDLHWFLFLNVF